MAAADYLHCSNCGQKAVYWTGDEAGALVEALCRECHETGNSFAVRRPATEGGQAPELLAKLRAAGVEPMPDDHLMTIAAMLAKGVFPNLTKETALRFAADLLEARAKLAELRAWANQEADPCAHDPEQDIARRRCADAVLAILDREAP